jgi:hypothetical protein
LLQPCIGLLQAVSGPSCKATTGMSRPTAVIGFIKSIDHCGEGLTEINIDADYLLDDESSRSLLCTGGDNGNNFCTTHHFESTGCLQFFAGWLEFNLLLV